MVEPVVLVALLELALTTGIATCSPADRPLRICVVESPTTPVITGWETCLPLRTTVTVETPARVVIAPLGTLIPCACDTTIDADALIPSRKPASSWSSTSVTSKLTTPLLLVGNRLMLVTCAASSSFGSASTVTSAGWPTLTLLMLDSLIGTTSCIPLVSIRVMNAEPDPDDPVEPELDDELPEELAPFDELFDEELEAPVEDPFPDTVSPTAPEIAATVPANGAYSFVSSTASCALLTDTSADSTFASADFKFAASVAAVTAGFVAVVEVVEEPSLLLPLLLPALLPPVLPLEPDLPEVPDLPALPEVPDLPDVPDFPDNSPPPDDRAPPAGNCATETNTAAAVACTLDAVAWSLDPPVLLDEAEPLVPDPLLADEPVGFASVSASLASAA